VKKTYQFHIYVLVAGKAFALGKKTSQTSMTGASGRCFFTHQNGYLQHTVDLEKNGNNVEPLEKPIYYENQHNIHEKCGLTGIS
jgi:hypothetical protein